MAHHRLEFAFCPFLCFWLAIFYGEVETLSLDFVTLAVPLMFCTGSEVDFDENV